MLFLGEKNCLLVKTFINHTIFAGRPNRGCYSALSGGRGAWPPVRARPNPRLLRGVRVTGVLRWSLLSKERVIGGGGLLIGNSCEQLIHSSIAATKSRKTITVLTRPLLYVLDLNLERLCSLR